jgi:cytochrome P450
MSSKGCPVHGADAFSTFNPHTVEDPFPVLAELRETCPATWSEKNGGFWYLTRYEDIVAALKRTDLFSSEATFLPRTKHPVFGPEIPMHIDRPDHTTYRKIMAPYFAPKQVAAMEDEIRANARELLEPFVAAGGGDFVSAFAKPFPASSFLPLLGLDRTEVDVLVELLDELLITAKLGPSADGSREARRDAALHGLRDRLTDILDARAGMEDPPDDIVTGLLASTFGDRDLSRDEILRMIRLFFAAGLDTIKHTLSMSLWFLATHDEQRRELVADPSLIPGAAEELLRYFSTVTAYARLVTQDVEFAGVQMREGDMLLLPIIAANRDPAKFSEPETVDFRRAPNPQIGYGAGPHRCAGSHLARLELKVALEEIHRAMPDYALPEDFEPTRTGGQVSGIPHLPIVIPDRAAA